MSKLADELAETKGALRIERSSSSWRPAVGALLLLGLGLLVAATVMVTLVPPAVCGFRR